MTNSLRSGRWLRSGLLASIAILMIGVPWSATSGSAAADVPFIKAVWYSSDDPERYGSDLVPGDLELLRDRLCLSHILIKTFVFQDAGDSVDPRLHPDFTVSDETLIGVIDRIQQAGVGVVLLPVLFVGDGTWEGAIAPSDIDEWFQHWETILLHYADIAEDTGIDVFLVGSEMVSLRDHHQQWIDVIESVRDRYSGHLSYSANWWFDENFYRSVLNMAQWQALDYIGVTGYFELTTTKDPSVGDLEAAWRHNRNGRNVLNDLDRLHMAYDGKPIVFWEFGYQSKDGANTEPWNFLLQEGPDVQEQADAYEAFFNVFTPLSWWHGLGVFAEQVGLPSDPLGYGVLGKPAEDVIAAQHCIP